MERLQTIHGIFNVYLNRINISKETFFHVSFVDNKNKLHVLHMHNHLNEWKFVADENLPEWIIALESQFHSLIMKVILREFQMLKAV